MNRIYIRTIIITLLSVSPSYAAETVTHQYDELGRLIQTSKSGGATNGVQTSTTYDPAGNRSNQTTTGSSVVGPPAPPNQSPVANGDRLTMPKCSVATINVIANDTDPEGHYPLTLLSVTSGQIIASVANASSVLLESNDAAGVNSVTYTVRDGLGATSNGLLSVSVSGGICN